MPKRTVTALLLLAVGFPVLLFGGIPYFLFMGFLITVSAWEYAEMFRKSGSRPAIWFTILFVLAVAISRNFFPSSSTAVLTISILSLMAYHLVDFELGAEHAGLDFSVSLGALIYLGWIGSYLFDLRLLQNGGWWVMFVLPCVWMADTGAYTIGAAYGKHKMTPRLSPKKSWEGYIAGAFTSLLTGAFFAYAFSTWGPLHLPIYSGAAFGLVVGLLTPLGDLGESMLKRQAGMKDSGTIFPGHGGAFDRIDSWLWAAVLGYYYITWFVR